MLDTRPAPGHRRRLARGGRSTLPGGSHGTPPAPATGMEAILPSVGPALSHALAALRARLARARRRGVIPRLLVKRVPRRAPRMPDGLEPRESIRPGCATFSLD